MSVLGAVLAAAAPALVAKPALAEKTPSGAVADGPVRTTPDGARTERKHAVKAHAAKQAEAKAAAIAPKDKKTKKTASRTGAKGKKTAKRAESPKRPCLGTPIALDRAGLEGQTLRLVDCHDRPVEAAQVALSVLARPWGAPKPALFPAPTPKGKAAASKGPPSPAAPRAPGELAPGVRLLDKGLLARVDAVAHRFPGRPISLVSGYRPQSRGSQHQSARALDLRVAGVHNEELVAFCKTLADTGCGYYPNSSFVHIDVRDPGTGGVSWIDASGPGEAPRYVHRWPPLEEPSAAAPPPDGQPPEGTDDPWGLDGADERAAPPGPLPSEP
jgi:hypothetical protein